MRYFLLSSILLIVITTVTFLIIGTNQTNSHSTVMPSIPYTATPGKILECVLDSGDISGIEHKLLIFPTEIYFGDTVYVLPVDKNISYEIIYDYIDFDGINWYNIGWTNVKCSISFRIPSSIKYSWKPEYPDSTLSDAQLERDLQPWAINFQGQYFFEFPPLEDKEKRFWKKLEKNLSPEGFKCQFHIRCDLGEPENLRQENSFAQAETTIDILIKPRPDNEKALLDKWYNNTPEKLFPYKYNSYKIPYDDFLTSSKKNDIRIGENCYDPWMFVRIGNRKPSDPNNPTTLQGWRELEASLIPSTMRDEVRFVRLQLEYYSAKEGKDTDIARQALVTWLQDIPAPQRAVMVNFLVMNTGHFREHTELQKKNEELISAISNMLDTSIEEISYHNSKFIKGKRNVLFSLTDAIAPTALDLLEGTKELPDNYYIWEFDTDIGRVRQVGRFSDFNETKDTLSLQTRVGNYDFRFSELIESDKAYARKLKVNKENQNKSSSIKTIPEK